MLLPLLAIICLAVNQATADTATNSLYHVRIVASNANLGYKRGAGSLITDKYVLTAAQLVYSYTNWSLEFLTLEHAESSEAKYSPLFDANTLNNDIAIVKVPSNSEHITIGLPKMTLVPANVFVPVANEQVRIIGDSVDCHDAVDESVTFGEEFLRTSDARFCHLVNNNTDYPMNFCTMGSGNGEDYCLAEIGSGATAVYYGQTVLVGVTSSRSNELVTSFTRVALFVDWIIEICL